MDWQTFSYGYFAYNIYDQVTHQADLCGWYTVTPTFYDGPNGATGTLDITAYAWSGMVSSGYWMGTDAVRVVSV